MVRAPADGVTSERTALLKVQNVDGEADESAKAASAGHKSNKDKVIIVSALFCGCLLFALDGSIVTTLAPAISSSFGSAQLAPSLGTFYLAGAAATSPLYGKTSDIYGRRPLLVFAAVIFAIGTLGCATTPSIELMLFWRLVAGVGGAGILSTGQVVLSDLVSQRRRGLLQGIQNTVFAMGFALGGPLGGFLNDSLGWRSAFYLQLPLNALAILAYVWKVDIPLPFYEAHLSRWQRLKRIDWLGSACIILGVFGVIAGLQMGGNVVEWDEWPVWVTLAGGLAFFGLFLYVEARVAVQPTIALDVLFSRTVATTAIANFCQALVIFSMIFQLPYYFLVVLGLSPSDAGLHYLPQSVGLAIGSIISGQIISLTGRYQPMLIAYNVLMIATPVLIASMWISNADIWDANYWRYYVDVSLIGLGNGASLPCLLVANIASVKYFQMATVTSINAFTRSIGQVLGVSLSSALVQESVKRGLAARLAGRSDAAELINRIRGDITSIKELPADVRVLAVSSYKDALRLLFILLACFAGGAMLACAAVPQHKLSEKAPADEDDDESSDEG